MRIFIRLITACFATVLSITLLLSVAVAYLIMTPVGGKLLVRYIKQELSSQAVMHVGHYSGNLQNGFIVKDIRIIGIPYLPGALLRIQEIQVNLSLWDLPHYDCRIFNARIFMPDSDPIVFTGEVYSGQIKGNLYTNSVDINQIIHFWTNDDFRRNLEGFISNLDVNLQGALNSPQISGHFVADNIKYRYVLITNGKSRLNMVITPGPAQVQVKGEVDLDSGQVKVRQTTLGLAPSKFIFRGDIFNPDLDIHLGSKVEDMDVNLTIKGTPVDPQLLITSDPPMSPQDALEVLFTGNAFSSSTTPFNGVTSGELAQDFLNYSLSDINEQQQIGLKTRLTRNLKLGVEMDQLPEPVGYTNTYYSRKINGEMDLNDHMSLNVSQEVFPEENYVSLGGPDTPTEAETEIYVQYKKRF